MARDFDGTDDVVSFGSDASLDDWTQRSVLFWGRFDLPASNYDVAISKNGTNDTGWQVSCSSWLLNGWQYTIQTYQRFDGAASGEWAAQITQGLHHIAIVYDRSSTANNPTFYVDGAVAGSTYEAQSPVGAATSDAAYALRAGELDNGSSDYDGGIACLTLLSSLVDAAAVNRHRWWGRLGGAQVQHPMFTTKLANEGAATADGTATGTTMIAMPRVQRPGAPMMGMMGL